MVICILRLNVMFLNLFIALYSKCIQYAININYYKVKINTSNNISKLNNFGHQPLYGNTCIIKYNFAYTFYISCMSNLT